MRVAGLRIVSAVALVSTLVVAGDSGASHASFLASARKPKGRSVWVAVEGANRIAKVNLTSQEVVARRSVPGAPHNLSISPSGRTIATALWSAGSIVVRRKGKQRTVSLGGAPHDVKIDGGRVVVANQTEARLDLVTPKGKFRRSIRLKADPHDLALRRGGRQAWVSLEGSDDLAVVHIPRPSKVRYVSTGKAPHDLLFAPDGKLWVSDWAGAIHVFSKKGRRIKTIPMGVEAHHLDFTPDGRQVWITDHAAERIFVVDTRRYKILKRFKAQGAPHHIAITADGDRAAVADHDRGLVVIYNVNTFRRGKTIRVGAEPHGIWAMP
jgi:DNA-binding beta-propeller fold protein YncE